MNNPFWLNIYHARQGSLPLQKMQRQIRIEKNRKPMTDLYELLEKRRGLVLSILESDKNIPNILKYSQQINTLDEMIETLQRHIYNQRS